METVFGKHNEIQWHQLGKQLVSLNTRVFSCIQDYLSQLKTLILLVQECKISKLENQCIYVIIAKHGLPYSIFVYMFYFTKEDIGVDYKKTHSWIFLWCFH